MLKHDAPPQQQTPLQPPAPPDHTFATYAALRRIVRTLSLPPRRIRRFDDLARSD